MFSGELAHLPTSSVAAISAPAPIVLRPWRIITLSERHDIRCLIDAEDYDWLAQWCWNYGWHNKTPWKFYAKRNEGPARSTIYMHREVLIRATPGGTPKFFATHHGHHGNGQSLDNRKTNLAWATPALNSSIRCRRADIPTIEEIAAKLEAEYAPRVTLAAVPFP